MILNKEQITSNKDKSVCHKNGSRSENHLVGYCLNKEQIIGSRFVHEINDYSIEMDSQVYCLTKKNIKGYS